MTFQVVIRRRTHDLFVTSVAFANVNDRLALLSVSVDQLCVDTVVDTPTGTLGFVQLMSRVEGRYYSLCFCFHRFIGWNFVSQFTVFIHAYRNLIFLLLHIYLEACIHTQN